MGSGALVEEGDEGEGEPAAGRSGGGGGSSSSEEDSDAVGQGAGARHQRQQQRGAAPAASDADDGDGDDDFLVVKRRDVYEGELEGGVMAAAAGMEAGPAEGKKAKKKKKLKISAGGSVSGTRCAAVRCSRPSLVPPLPHAELEAAYMHAPP